MCEYEYKYEMHLHSKRTSACAVAEATEYVRAAKELGYAGMTFTNHFIRGNTAISRDIPWKNFTEEYKKDWEIAKGLGDKENIDVLFGLEEGYGGGKECLIYGLTPEVFAECEEFRYMNIAKISEFVRACGGFIACAHPYRVRDYIINPLEEPNPNLFDGVEVYNRANSLEENLTAHNFAVKYGLTEISGGDIHRVQDFGKSGIAFPRRVRSEKELAEVLKIGNFKMITDGEKNNF